MYPRRLKNSKAGFSLIEVLIVMFIISVAFVSFYTVSSVGTRYIIQAKNRLGAVAFANEKMEIVRNLAYDKVGVQGSLEITNGKLFPDQTVTANGRSYRVLTSVHYFDDPLDGTATTSPADTIPNDYKIVEVVVSWIDSDGQTQSVSSTSRFVPPGLETSENGAPLSINVIDGDTLLPIHQASVNIINNTVSPPISDNFMTDINGHIMIPSAFISSGNILSITKNGYETVTTMDSSALFTPVYRHISVVAGFLNSYNYFQNKLASLVVRTADYKDNPIGNIGFSIAGGKVIGNDDLGNIFYSMESTPGITGAVSGEKEFANVSSGNYSVVAEENAQYAFIDYDPESFPVFLSPDSILKYTLRMADKNVNALFLKVKDADAPNAPIAAARVTLTDGAADVFTDELSSLNGVVFYPKEDNILENKSYTLKIEADGYNQNVQTIFIDKLTPLEVNLSKI